MTVELNNLKRARYYTSVAIIYAVTLLFTWNLFSPYPLFERPVDALRPTPKVVSAKPLIFGRPDRIVISSLNIDVPVDKGVYNRKTNSWTLSDYHAHFATITSLANNRLGSTFIYGHNSDPVFGPLYLIKKGAKAKLYTTNGRIFYYSFSRSKNVKPKDVNILNYSGPPVLTVQTCGGQWFEKRQIFTFKFEKVRHES